MNSVLLESHHNKTHVVTLNREKALNSLDMDMIARLIPIYRNFHQELSTKPSSQVVVMKGAGQKAFCAGGDVVALAKDTPTGVRKQFFYDEYQVDYAIATLPCPHVAIWDGIVMGGGFGVSAHGSHRICTESTLFAMPETGIGLFPDVGGSWFLPRLPHEGLGMFLALTGHRLKGPDVFYANVGTHYIPKTHIAELLTALTAADFQPETLNATLAKFESKPEAPFSLSPNLDDIKTFFGSSPTSVEHIIDRLKSANTEWSNKQVSTLSKMSPSSMKVSFELQRVGAKAKDIKEIFQIEYLASQRCMETNDFKSGVTALLIDKTNKPVWEPSTLEGVTPEIVASHFRKTTEATVDWHPTNPFPVSAKV